MHTTLMAVLLSLGIIIGLALLLYAVFFQRNENGKRGNGGKDDMERIKSVVEEADETLSNINSVSSMIIEEIDIKYKELLFLYQMLEEKKKELAEQTDGRVGYNTNYNGGAAGHVDYKNSYYDNPTGYVDYKNNFNENDVRLVDYKNIYYGNTAGHVDYKNGYYGTTADENRTYPNYNAAAQPPELDADMGDLKALPKLKKQAAIFVLSSKGYDVTQIAKELGMGKGEVSLILGLNKVGMDYE